MPLAIRGTHAASGWNYFEFRSTTVLGKCVEMAKLEGAQRIIQSIGKTLISMKDFIRVPRITY